MKLLAISSYRYQKTDRSRHTLRKYLNDEKAHRAINNKFFERLNCLNRCLSKVESIKSKVEHKEPEIVGFFILQCSKLFFYNFFHRFCDFISFEEMEMDTDSLHLALAHNCREDCIKPELKETWNSIQKLTAATNSRLFQPLNSALEPGVKSNTKNENLDCLRRILLN